MTEDISKLSLRELRDQWNITRDPSDHRFLNKFAAEIRRRWKPSMELHADGRTYTLVRITDTYTVTVRDADGHETIWHPCKFDEWRETP